MIKTVHDNILNSPDNLICHQVNCKGVMGAGLALQIKNKYPMVYNGYKNACDLTYNLLGKCQMISIGKDKYIVNLFSQQGYGRDRRHTDYDALRSCLTKIRTVSNDNGWSIALPYGIGCGLAGGDWNTVYSIIKEVFDNHSYNVTLYKLK